MRVFVAALALAGALILGCSAGAIADDRPFASDRDQLAQGVNSIDVTRAKRCAPPFGCKPKRSPRAPWPDYRADVAQLVDAAAIAEGVPARLARALVRVESNFVASLVGREGEIGLTQIKYETARGLGFRGTRAALFDPATNLKWGFRHARRALDLGSIGFHQAGLGARRVSARYVDRINAAMGQ